MGIVLILFSLSETLLPSGIKIIRDEPNLSKQISLGLEINPHSFLSIKARGLFTKRGYNYLYLKNADSLPILLRFVHLLSMDSLFYPRATESPMNLLRLALRDYGGNTSPVINVTVAITGRVDEYYIMDLFSSIPDSVISNISNYYTLKPLQGKHIYYGNEDFIANISPNPDDDGFLSFLVCLQIISDRGFDVEFSPETAPSPFVIHVNENDVGLIFKKPVVKEVKKGINQVYNWMESELDDRNRSQLLIMGAEMGINKEKFRNWAKSLSYLTIPQLREIWERYLLDGFISSSSQETCSLLIQLFPEAEIIR
jgi:hypothetical protein